MHSPTYKYGHYTKLMQIKLFIAYKSIEIALKYTKTRDLSRIWR